MKNHEQLNNLYEEKNIEYFQEERPEMLKYIPKESLKILDVGCGCGNFGGLVKTKFNAEVWGVELDQKAASMASRKLDRVICGSFDENLSLPNNSFDCILFNDVLEHLIEPEKALLHAKKLLASQGIIVASIPNVRYIENVYDIMIKGNWEYKDCGILDKTHLRFFTHKSIIKMFKKLGYSVDCIEGINSFETINYPLCMRPQRKKLFVYLFNFLDMIFAGKIWDMRYQQFAIVAH